MELGYFDYYVIGINILGFILFLINKWLLNHTPDKEIHSILTIVSLLGGSLGVLISILIFDHEKLNSNERKEIMMSRVFVICLSIIQIILFLILKGFIRNELTIAFWEYFGTHKILFAYLIIINIIAIIVFGVDKIAAAERKSRIRIVTLLVIAFFGGSIGSLIAMYAFRHKIKKDYFVIGIPLILLMQIVILFYCMNGTLFSIG